LIAALALALQALLATWPTSADIEGSDHPQIGLVDHGAEHHAHGLVLDGVPPPPSPGSDHHAKFCCILGGKLGTALALAPTWSFVEPSRRSDVASAPHVPGVRVVLLRPQRPFRARAPPLAG